MNMYDYDPQKAARVWQRVQGNAIHTEPGGIPEAGPAPRSLPALILDVQQDAGLYFQLSRRFQGRDNALLRHLAEETQSQVACLQGIHALQAGTRPAGHAQPPFREPTEALLRRCFGQAVRRIAEYESRTTEPAYGSVFARLAAQTGVHCQTILEILGRWREKG